MILSFAVISQEGHYRTFTAELGQFEEALDFLQTIINMGDAVVQAYFVEGEKTVEIPLEVMDGKPFTEPIQQLQQEWEALLKISPDHSVEPDQPVSQLVLRLMMLKQDKINHLREAIRLTEDLLRSTQVIMPEGPYKTRLIHRYQDNLDRYQASLLKTITYFPVSLNRTDKGTDRS